MAIGQSTPPEFSNTLSGAHTPLRIARRYLNLSVRLLSQRTIDIAHDFCYNIGKHYVHVYLLNIILG